MYFFPAGNRVGGVGTQAALVQTSFAVSTSGNDNAAGTPTQPWRTLARLQRALEGQRLNETVDTTVSIAAGTYLESLTLSCIIPAGRNLIVSGARTTQHTGVIGAFTALNPGASTPAAIQDATMVAANHVNRRFRMTSGGALTAIAWGLLATAADTMRISQFAQPATPGDISDGSIVNPANGDSYVIETLDTIISNYDLRIGGGGQVVINDITFDSSVVTMYPASSFGFLTTALLRVGGCRFSQIAQFVDANYVHVGCLYQSTNVHTGLAVLQGAAVQTASMQVQNGLLVIDGPTCFQSGDNNPRISVNFLGQIQMDGPIGIFNDVAGNASVSIDSGAQVISKVANNIFWDNGANAKTNGIRVFGGGRRLYTTIDTLNGAVNDTLLGGVASTYAAIVAAPLGSILTGNDAGFILRA